jgi:hypothetical protein
MALLNVVLQILNDPDPCSLMALIAVLALVGNLMTRNMPHVHAWGYRLSASAGVGYGVYGVWKFEPVRAYDVLDIVIRALFAAGSLGFWWIVLASLAFVYVNTVLRVRYAMLMRAARRFEEQRQRILLNLMIARRDLQATAVTTIVEQPVAKTETVGEIVARERRDHEDRMAAINELQASGVIDEDMREELQANELERYTRRLTDVLGYCAG